MAARVGAIGVVCAGLSALVARGQHVACNLVSHSFVENIVDTLLAIHTHTCNEKKKGGGERLAWIYGMTGMGSHRYSNSHSSTDNYSA